jgi:hypothetical protein
VQPVRDAGDRGHLLADLIRKETACRAAAILLIPFGDAPVRAE